MTRSGWAFAAVALLAAASACSGGGSNLAPQPSGTGGSGSSVAIDKFVTFTVQVPRLAQSSTRRRRPLDTVYVSPNTGSISIQLGAVDGLSVKVPPAPTVANVPSNCVGSSSGCAVAVRSVPAADGDDTFVVTTFSGPNASGSVVSQGVVPLTVGAGGGSGTIGGPTLRLGGFVASIELSVTPGYFLRGRPGDTPVVVVPKDATGAVIIGNAQFAHPIQLAASPTPQLQITGLPFVGGVAVLKGPQQVGSPIDLHYNGSADANTGQVTAKSIDSNGAGIAAAVTISVLDSTPQPTPSPTPSGFKPPPGDVYVVNGEDDTVVELTGAATPQPSGAPVRTFGGYNVAGCRPQLGGLSSLAAAELGISGLSIDGNANAYLGNGGGCTRGGQTFYEFGPAASGNATPSATFVSGAPIGGNYIALYIDPATGFLEVSDGSQAAYLSEYLASGSTAQLVAAFGALGLTASGTCILTPGVPACTGPPAPNSFVTAPLGIDDFDQFARTFTIDGRGNYYYAAKDTTLFNLSIVQIPSNQVIPVDAPIAAAPWLRGINTFTQSYTGTDADRVSNYPVGLAVDGNFLYVLNAPFTGLAFGHGGVQLTDYFAPAAACNPSPAATPSPVSKCSDGTPHEYLTAYDLRQLTSDGPNDLEPVLVAGGNGFPGGKAAGGYFGNRLAIGGGNVFIADPAGLQCDAACFSAIGSLGKTPVGQISVYPESLRGVHIGDASSNPSVVIAGPSVKFPTGVATGPAGSPKLRTRRR